MKLSPTILIGATVEARNEKYGCHAEEMQMWKSEMKQWKNDQKGINIFKP